MTAGVMAARHAVGYRGARPLAVALIHNALRTLK